MKKTIFVLLTLALSMASAKTYPITLTTPAVVAGTTLTPGEYVLDFDGAKATLKRGKVTVDCPVKVQKVEKKYPNGSLRFANRDGKMHLSEIRLGGTDTKLVVD